jgi:hypothetical protein
MPFPMQLPGFEGQTLQVQPAGLFAGPRLLVNGQPARPGLERGHLVLRRNDGREVIAAWKPQLLGLDVPRLVVDGQLVEVAPPLPWYVWLWSGLPILLILVGGALGTLAGFVAFVINMKLFRTRLPRPLQFVLTALVSLLCAAGYLVLATLIYSYLHATVGQG